jgi:hypothetical protein
MNGGRNVITRVFSIGSLQVLLCGAALSAEPVRIAADSAPNARQPQAAIDPAGRIHVVFGSGDSIFHCQSAAGATFDSPTRIPTQGKLSLGMRRGPRVAATADAVVMTAILGERGGGRDGDVLAWRSSDGGKSWDGPARVNDVPGAAREGLHALAAARDGRLYSVWLDLRNGKTEIFGSGSTDGGLTWSQNKRVYRSPSGSVCECCHPSVAFDPEGTLHVMWRNSFDGNRDMYLATSRDNGATFGKARKLGAGAWPLDACPMDGGALAVGAKGKVTSVWRRASDVFTLGSGRKEQRLAAGEQPWCAATPQGAYLVWISRRPGELWLKSPESPPDKIADNANDPVIAAGDSETSPVVVVWESGSGGGDGILALVVPHD